MPQTIRKLALLAALLAAVAGCSKRKAGGPIPETQSDAAYRIRVLLCDGVRECEINSASGMQVKYGDGQDVVDASETVRVTFTAGRLSLNGNDPGANKLVLSCGEPHILRVNGEDFRGQVAVVLSVDANSFDVINSLSLEPYLAGVIGAEMPAYWEAEALKAQAIAARTYCLYIKNRFGGGREWDVRRTQAHQAYNGVRAESARIWDAVNKTRGQVCVCDQGGRLAIFPAYYSSTCGGHTENSENVFGDSFGPLKGVACPYCREVAKAKSFLWPMARYDKAEVSERLLQRYAGLAELEAIEDIRVAAQTDYDSFARITNVRLVGTNGKKNSVRGEDLRLAIDPSGAVIKSAIFKIECIDGDWTFMGGRGYGHGVGMCQCGAEGMAREGKTAGEILSYYYPGSRIGRIY
jgi:stage II sporulation protein D